LSTLKLIVMLTFKRMVIGVLELSLEMLMVFSSQRLLGLITCSKMLPFKDIIGRLGRREGCM